MYNTLVLPDNIKGFKVRVDGHVNATRILEGEMKRAAPPPPKKKDPAPPRPDPEEVRRKTIAEMEPRIRQEAEQRVRQEEEAKYKQQLAEEVKLMRAQQDKRFAEEETRRNAVVSQLQHQFDQFVRDMKAEIAEQVIERSVDIAELLLRHELPDKQMVLTLLRGTLAPISDLQGAKVRINPEDLKLLKGDDAEDLPYDGQFEWAADGSLQPGDLVIESRNGIFDASLNQRITLLKEQLRRQVGTLTTGT
jgi:flagellar biosynthesis/type III secretory pathway protein FliH